MMLLQKKWCNFYPLNVYILNKVRSHKHSYILLTLFFSNRKHCRFNTGFSLETSRLQIKLAQKSRMWPWATTWVILDPAKSLWLTSSNRVLKNKKVPLIHTQATFQGSLHQSRRCQSLHAKMYQLRLCNLKYLNLKRVPVVKCLSKWNLRWVNRKVSKTCKNGFHHRIRQN